MSTPRGAGRPPGPAEATSLDDVTSVLLELREWAGSPSYNEIARRVSRRREQLGEPGRPGRVTVYDCFRPGRRRVDERLLLDIAAVLGGEATGGEATGGGDVEVWRTALHRLAPAGALTRSAVGRSELPAPREVLVGRSSELAALAALAPGGRAVVSGLAGAGKSELVLHVAARWLARLPAESAALYVDLRGFDGHRPPLSAAAALTALLAQLDVPPDRSTRLNLEAQRELLRRRLHERPSVVVIDNAPDLDLLRATLPDLPTARVLVTSRRVLTGGDLAPSWLALDLQPLDVAGGTELLTRRLGAARTSAEPEAVRQLVDLTGGLALELTLVAASVASHPDWSLADHAHRLRAAPREHHMHPALLLSYNSLPDDARLTFRALGLYPGARVPLESVALLLDQPVETVTRSLSVLEREHLLRRDGDDLVLHDAVAAFARSRVQGEEPRSRQIAAVERLAHGWVDLVRTATAEPGPHQWLDEELPQILAVAGLAKEWGTSAQTLELSTMLTLHLSDTGQLSVAEQLHRAAAEASGDRAARLALGRALEMQGRFREAHEQLVLALDPHAADAERALNGIGNVLKRLGRLDEAIATYHRAADLAAERGNDWTRGRALANLADTLRFRGDPDAAAPLYEEALAISRGAGDEVSCAIIVANQAVAAFDAGDLPEAIRLAKAGIAFARSAGYDAGLPSFTAQLALALQESGETEEAALVRAESQELATQAGQRDVLCWLLMQRGVAAMTHSPTVAVAAFEDAIALSRELGNPLHECTALLRLAELAVADGDVDVARAHLEQAGDIATRMGLAPERELVAVRLSALPGPPNAGRVERAP